MDMNTGAGDVRCESARVAEVGTWWLVSGTRRFVQVQP